MDSLVARDVAQAGAVMFCARTSMGCADAVEVAAELDEEVRMSSGCDAAAAAEGVPGAPAAADFLVGVVVADEDCFSCCCCSLSFEGGDDGGGDKEDAGGGGDGVWGIVRRPPLLVSSRG